MKRIDLSYVTVENRDGIVWLVFKEGVEIDVKELKEFTQASEVLSDNEPYLLISDARVNLSITSEARKLAASKKGTSLLIANAVLVNNLAVRLTANFFTSFNKPHFKYRVFNDESKALRWIKKYHAQKELV
jgi:hypothetical protein